MKGLCLTIFALITTMVSAQTYEISGTVTDASTGESLIGVNILYGPGKGTVTDMDGNYVLNLANGNYELSVSYVGFEKQSRRITVAGKSQVVNFQLKNVTLSEVEVVADIAQTRETPVAFSTITPKQINEELASQDIPMLLNRTPGVYATQQGGGDGDSRINIRGFNQRNVAVMIDGLPVNDMENGWVYWSNWFGLDIVTRRIQVQRGLGASKLAIPSVGGTVNIITTGIEDKSSISLKQEVGSDGFLRTSLGYNSGNLGKGWGITAAGSYKRGNGWVDQTWTKGWFYYLRVDKKMGKHLLSLSAMGAPQKHGQRAYMNAIATYDKKYAAELGVDTSTVHHASRGIKYNPNWGYLQRQGEEREPLNQTMNYYHKPLFSLRDYWNVNDKLYISNILYASLGKGGGTGTATSDQNGTPGSSTLIILPETGQIDFQTYYDKNISEDRSRAIIRSSVNDHYWYGLLSSFNYTMSDKFELSGGIDLRSYRGVHYMQVYDLLGGQYFLDNTDKNTTDIVRREGDMIRYHDESRVRWGGLFGLLKYQQGNITAFFNVSASESAYKRVDYYMKKTLTVGDTVLNIGAKDTITYQGNVYTASSPGLEYNQTKWKLFPGVNVKAGINYNLSERSNVFFNIGLLSKSPRFNNVFYYNNVEFTDAANEIVKALELGYSYYAPKITIELNGYLTKWQNKPADFTSTYVDPLTEDTYQININGMDALHMGIEADISHKIGKIINWDHILSIGDWRWTSSDSARKYINQQLAENVFFDAKGVHVGDAAQIQWSESIRWQIIRKLYLRGVFTYFAKNYSQFDPFSLNPDQNPNYLGEDGKPRDSWKMPNYYLIDLHAGYGFKVSKLAFELRASVLNLLDREYISDANNNDSYSETNTSNNFDAASASVFFGLGRRFNVSLQITF